MIKEILDPGEKTKITVSVLGSLPDWFGQPESILDYSKESRNLSFWAAYRGEIPIGFIALKPTSKATAEVFVMGVLSQYHRTGIGRGLYETFERYARSHGYSYAQVKTVRMGCYPDYDKTNRFYQAMGFSELECFPTLWDECNPCQIYVKYIGWGSKQ